MQINSDPTSVARFGQKVGQIGIGPKKDKSGT